MAKKKDCFGSESYVCRTKDCPYVSDCVQAVWEKKLRRVLTRKKGTTMDDRAAKTVRVRSKEFLAR